MAISKRFVIVKTEDSDDITYMEYNKKEGFNVRPKKDLKIEDMINVNEMIIINPSLIEKLIEKKCKRYLTKIIKMLSIIDEDGTDDNALHLALDEIEKFRQLLINKYQQYMEKQEYDLLLKKIAILDSEIKLRNQNIEFEQYNNKEEKQGKKGR